MLFKTLYRHTLCYGTVHKMYGVCMVLYIRLLWGEGGGEDFEEVLTKAGIGLLTKPVLV